MSLTDYVSQVRQLIKQQPSFSTHLTDGQLKLLIESTCSPMDTFKQLSTRDKLNVLNHIFYFIFIGGGTGSGKTTFLNALSAFIPRTERIITIEDAAELQIRSIPNLISLETRNANTEGKGEISIRDLIKASLRMRPNRIVVGEVRGSEALDMLAAMNTGHEGSMSTGHANNVMDMLSRLETMVLSGFELPLPVVRKQICAAIDIMVHLSRFSDGRRGVTEISQLTRLENGEIIVEPLYERNSETHFQLKRTSFSIFRQEKLEKV